MIELICMLLLITSYVFDNYFTDEKINVVYDTVEPVLMDTFYNKHLHALNRFTNYIIL